MDTPQSAILAILKEHAKWQKQLQKRHTPEYLKYKSINLEIIITTITTLLCRSKLKQEASHHHEQEKDFMVTLQTSTIITSSYSTDSALEEDTVEVDRLELDEEVDNPITFVNAATDSTVESGKPLLFMYDCETTGGSHLWDHIMEVGSVVLVPDGVSITTTEFSSVFHTSQHITRQGKLISCKFILMVVNIVSEKCGITGVTFSTSLPLPQCLRTLSSGLKPV